MKPLRWCRWPSVFAAILTLGFALTVASEPQKQAGDHTLSTHEITLTFADVLDNARVVDTANSTAQNHWYADGRFISRWRTGEKSGTVHGQWSAVDDKRCIVILSGLPDHSKHMRCGPIVQRGKHYLSFNADGSVHGVHTLSTLPPELLLQD